MKWSLRLSEFDLEGLYHPELDYNVPAVLSRLLYSSDTQDYEPIDKESLMLESSRAALRQRLKEKGVLCTSFRKIRLSPLMVLHRVTLPEI